MPSRARLGGSAKTQNTSVGRQVTLQDFFDPYSPTRAKSDSQNGKPKSNHDNGEKASIRFTRSQSLPSSLSSSDASPTPSLTPVLSARQKRSESRSGGRAEDVTPTRKKRRGTTPTESPSSSPSPPSFSTSDLDTFTELPPHPPPPPPLSPSAVPHQAISPVISSAASSSPRDGPSKTPSPSSFSSSPSSAFSLTSSPSPPAASSAATFSAFSSSSSPSPATTATTTTTTTASSSPASATTAATTTTTATSSSSSSSFSFSAPVSHFCRSSAVSAFSTPTSISPSRALSSLAPPADEGSDSDDAWRARPKTRLPSLNIDSQRKEVAEAKRQKARLEKQLKKKDLFERATSYANDNGDILEEKENDEFTMQSSIQSTEPLTEDFFVHTPSLCLLDSRLESALLSDTALSSWPTFLSQVETFSSLVLSELSMLLTNYGVQDRTPLLCEIVFRCLMYHPNDAIRAKAFQVFEAFLLSSSHLSHGERFLGLKFGFFRSPDGLSDSGRGSNDSSSSSGCHTRIGSSSIAPERKQAWNGHITPPHTPEALYRPKLSPSSSSSPCWAPSMRELWEVLMNFGAKTDSFHPGTSSCASSMTSILSSPVYISSVSVSSPAATTATPNSHSKLKPVSSLPKANLQAWFHFVALLLEVRPSHFSATDKIFLFDVLLRCRLDPQVLIYVHDDFTASDSALENAIGALLFACDPITDIDHLCPIVISISSSIKARLQLLELLQMIHSPLSTAIVKRCAFVLLQQHVSSSAGESNSSKVETLSHPFLSTSPDCTSSCSGAAPCMSNSSLTPFSLRPIASSSVHSPSIAFPAIQTVLRVLDHPSLHHDPSKHIDWFYCLVQLSELCVCGPQEHPEQLKPLLDIWKGLKARINMYHVPSMKLRDLLEATCTIYKQLTDPPSFITEWLAPTLSKQNADCVPILNFTQSLK